MGASTASKRKEKRENRNKKTAKEVKQAVEKKLGLKTTVPGPFDYMQDEKKTLAYNLEGKDKKFYGKEASAATNEELVKKGILKRGSQNPDGSWNYQQVSGSGYGASDIQSIKYGKSGGAMGSGDPTGAMSSIPISKEMLQQQNKIKAVTTGVLSLAMPTGSIGGFALRSAAGDAVTALQNPQKSYNIYQKKFTAKQEGKKFTQTNNTLGILPFKQEKKTLGE